MSQSNEPVTYGQTQGYEQPLEYRQPPMYDQPNGYCYSGEPNVVTTQGSLSYVSPNTVIVTSGERPPNAMLLAIFACLFCFWPTGVCAIIYANQANSELDTRVAWNKYRTSSTLSIVSIILGMLWIAIAVWRIMNKANYSNTYHEQTTYG
ncbi:hypothetical protein ACJMK2_032966 [Sinanodonta woodiana]|uniref:Uncharacterized protein n=1 Tax=Sinanodonta woodiana TaxID=1069815 RepID=A0ABD3X3E2_SINWO